MDQYKDYTSLASSYPSNYQWQPGYTCNKNAPSFVFYGKNYVFSEDADVVTKNKRPFGKTVFTSSSLLAVVAKELRMQKGILQESFVISPLKNESDRESLMAIAFAMQSEDPTTDFLDSLQNNTPKPLPLLVCLCRQKVLRVSFLFCDSEGQWLFFPGRGEQTKEIIIRESKGSYSLLKREACKSSKDSVRLPRGSTYFILKHIGPSVRVQKLVAKNEQFAAPEKNNIGACLNFLFKKWKMGSEIPSIDVYADYRTEKRTIKFATTPCAMHVAFRLFVTLRYFSYVPLCWRADSGFNGLPSLIKKDKLDLIVSTTYLRDNFEDGDVLEFAFYNYFINRVPAAESPSLFYTSQVVVEKRNVNLVDSGDYAVAFLGKTAWFYGEIRTPNYENKLEYVATYMKQPAALLLEEVSIRKGIFGFLKDLCKHEYRIGGRFSLLRWS